MSPSDRIFPICELLLGAAYADGELQTQEKTEIRALLVELVPAAPDAQEGVVMKGRT